ncbi:hypothetical protein EI77_04299 [Prosthecobacter fusiformis]|uniref:Uncharacterized protein n=1 Tax=Prosthecobacter fusiformis TaxID=48464 RepID=A0A4R7RKH4_9BACT|nr:hypothetical protein [Prosthecobacter fusiformis]TDU64115.1 hypothetical protein EI77_04299 [Prosthecobacter fusiformis]
MSAYDKMMKTVMNGVDETMQKVLPRPKPAPTATDKMMKTVMDGVDETMLNVLPHTTRPARTTDPATGSKPPLSVAGNPESSLKTYYQEKKTKTRPGPFQSNGLNG